MPKEDSYFSNLSPYTTEYGYALGFITSANHEGLWGFRTVEGMLQLGYASSEAYATSKSCVDAQSAAISAKTNVPLTSQELVGINAGCTRQINPFAFSSPWLDKYDELNTLKGGAVLISYTRRLFTVWTDTHIIIEDVWSTRDQKPMTEKSIEDNVIWLSEYIHADRGSLEGYAVKAAVVGNLRESYQITIQQGPSGNKFVDMNVVDSNVFNFIVEAMARGRYLRFSFVQPWAPALWPSQLFHNTRTDKRVIQVDILSSPHNTPES